MFINLIINISRRGEYLTEYKGNVPYALSTLSEGTVFSVM
jgi:hypothetical protein